MSLDTLGDAFYDELCDIYHAEKQLVKALPKMAKKASSEDLKAAFEAHLEETEEHVARVEAAFEDTGKAPKAKKCEAMEGLIEEATSMMEEEAEPEVMDAILIGCAQKVEHYKIATYGTLCTWAELLGYKNAVLDAAAIQVADPAAERPAIEEADESLLDLLGTNDVRDILGQPLAVHVIFSPRPRPIIGSRKTTSFQRRASPTGSPSLISSPPPPPTTGKRSSRYARQMISRTTRLKI